MANKNTMQRAYALVRRLSAGDFPSKAQLLERLAEQGHQIDPRTLERDFRHLESAFDFDVVYHPEKNGYSIEHTDTLDKTLHFLALAQSADVLLRSLGDKKGAMRRVSVAPTETPAGVEHLKPLLEALDEGNPRRTATAVAFDHTRYETGETVAYEAEPYLLKEFDGRWYLFAYVPSLGAFRTFGLDRIARLRLTERTFRREAKRAETAERFDDVYGLIYEPDGRTDAPREWVAFRASDFVAKHLAALPLHRSQSIDGNTVRLKVIVNPELTNRLLGYGEHVEVLEPQHLRERVQQRLAEALKHYKRCK